VGALCQYTGLWGAKNHRHYEQTTSPLAPSAEAGKIKDRTERILRPALKGKIKQRGKSESNGSEKTTVKKKNKTKESL